MLGRINPISRLKALIKHAAHRTGYEIRKTNEASTMQAALRRVAANHQITTVVDIGASDGRWSALALDCFPNASYLLIEAQEVHADALRARATRNDRWQYVLAAAGDIVGSIHFDTTDPFGGAAANEPFRDGDAIVPMTTVDAEVERLELGGPFLLKLDTHGFEPEILSGATRALRDTRVLIIEAYNFTLRPGALRFHELCDHLETLGFRTVDLVNVLRRPTDQILWQFDLVFARSDEAGFAISSYD